MKKLGVSLVAVLVGLPMIAHATVSDISNAGTVTANDHVATTSYVKGAYNAMASAVNTAIGQINTDIGTKQAQLKNNAGTPANISETVKTMVGAATGDNAASDTALVTEKAVRTAIDAAKSSTTYTAGSGVAISNNEISASGITTSNIAADAGIVKTQLASDVQTSLGLANSALQASNLDDVTIEKDATNGVQVKAGSIGTTQLSSGVNASLGLADSALQSGDIVEGSTNGTIAVDGTDVAVHGLGSAAYTASTAYDAAGTAAGLTGTLSNLTTAEQGNLVGAINEVNSKVLTVYTTWNDETSTGQDTVALTAPVVQSGE